MSAVTVHTQTKGSQVLLAWDGFEGLGNVDGEHESWLLLSRRGLARAYDEHDEEYPLEAIIEANPDYEGR